MDELNTGLISFTRFYLAAFFTFVATFYTIRIIWLQRTQHKSVIFPGKRFCATWWNHVLFRLFRAVIWLVCLARFFSPTADDYLGICTYLNNNHVVGSGLVLLSLGFSFTVFTHFAMKAAWRSGIDPNSPKALITSGLYARSRNPMFIGVIMAQIGFFLALPSIFTLMCLVIGVVAVYRQMQAEEVDLINKFKGTYQQYCQQVPRWL